MLYNIYHNIYDKHLCSVGIKIFLTYILTQIYMMLGLSESSGIKTEKSINNKASTKELDKTDYKQKIVWRSVIFFSYIHLAGLYGLYVFFRVKYWSVIWCMYITFISVMLKYSLWALLNHNL
jgi:hypothetical protein